MMEGASDAASAATWLGPLRLSLEIAGCATVCIAFIAIPLAYVLARRTFPGRALLEALVTLPLVLPPTVVGYLLIVVFGRQGWIGHLFGGAVGAAIVFQFPGAVIAAAVVALPMLYIPAKASFAAIDRDLEDTARLMGAGRLRTFWLVAIPLARAGIVSGLLLAFARALGEFGATWMVYGSSQNRLTLPISIYLDFETAELRHAAPAVIALSVFSLLLVLGYNHATGPKAE